MIPHDEDHVAVFDDGELEREWLVQESAMRRERLHIDTASDDARSQRYRLIARSLSQPMTVSLPEDFARQLAVRAGAVPSSATPSGASLESRLMVALTSTFVLAVVAIIAIYGSTWLPSFTALVPNPQAPATRWLVALAGCLGMSWLLGRWPQHT